MHPKFQTFIQTSIPFTETAFEDMLSPDTKNSGDSSEDENNYHEGYNLDCEEPDSESSADPLFIESI